MDTTFTAAAQSRRGLLLIVCAAVLWGTVGVVTKELYAISATTPFSIGFFRLAISVPVLGWACWRALGRRMFAVSRRDLGLMLLFGVMMALYQVCYFAAIARVGVAIAVLVTLCSAPVLVALLSSVFLRERLTRQVLLAMVCALGGTALLVGGGSSASGDGAQTFSGVLLALGSSLGYATLAMLSRTLAGRYHPLQPITFGFVVGALVLLPFALATGLVVTYPVEGWLLLLHLGLIPTALAYVLFLAGIRDTSATVASIVTLIEPLTSAGLAWIVFGERLGSLGFIGAALLLGAILLLVRRQVGRGEEDKEKRSL